MGRWRPPADKSSPYITGQGHAALRQELDDIWKRRREVTRHLAAAAAEGDRSENAEYIYRKKELRELDRRIRYLQKRLPELKVVDMPPADRNSVYFGAWVRLEKESGTEPVVCRIVGGDELTADKRHISVDSPMAKVLLGKSLDDEVSVVTPAGETRYCIIEIEYEESV